MSMDITKDTLVAAGDKVNRLHFDMAQVDPHFVIHTVTLEINGQHGGVDVKIEGHAGPDLQDVVVEHIV